MASNTSVPLPSASTISDIEQTVQIGLEALRNAPLNDQITAALRFLTPPGYRPIAQLEEDGRKKRSTAAASNWNPETGEIVIYFERLALEPDFNIGKTVPVHPANSSDSPPSGRQEAFAKSQRQAVMAALGEAPNLNLNLNPNPKTPSVERGAVPRSQVFAALGDSDVTDRQIQELCLALAEAEKAGKGFIALKWFRDHQLTAHGHAWAESLAQRQAVLTRAFEVGAVITSQIPNPKAPQHPTTTVKLNRESKYAQAVPPRFQPIQLRGPGLTASEILLRDRGRL